MLCKLELFINIKIIKGNGIISGEIKIEVVMVLSAIFKLNNVIRDVKELLTNYILV